MRTPGRRRFTLLAGLVGLAGLIAAGAVTPARAALDLGATTRHRLRNGLEVVVVERHQLPLTTLLLAVHGGQSADPPGKGGLTAFTVECLRRGAGARDARQTAEALDALGASLRSETGWDDARLTLDLLSRDVAAGLDLLADFALSPRFEAEEVAKAKRQALARIEQDKDDPETVASQHFYAAVFGAHPYGRPGGGTASTVSTFERADVAVQHAAWFVPGNALLVVVGDVQPRRVLAAIESRFAAWPGRERPALPAAEPALAAEGDVLLLDKPDSTQSQVRLGNVFIRRTDPDYEALHVANTALGEGFTSRLTDRLRVDLSLTYRAYSRVVGARQPGAFLVATFTPTETTRRIIDEARKLVEQVRSVGPSREEVEKAKGYRAGSLAIRLQENAAVAALYADVALYRLPGDYAERAVDRYGAVTFEQALAAARRLPGALKLVVLGKAETVQPQLEGLGRIEVKPFTTEP